MSQCIAILIATLCLFLFVHSTQQLLSSQIQVLYKLKRQLEYPKELAAWNGTKDLCHTPSSSSLMLTCEEESITELKIVGQKIARPSRYMGYSIQDYTLSESFSVDSFVTTLTRLSGLKVIILVSLGIWGPLPDKIHRLYSLEVLDLSSNFLYGMIPHKLSVLTRLQTLSLDGNYFNDTIPDWFGLFSNLTVLSLQRNQLQGSLSHSISSANTLTVLSFLENNISGKIPDLRRLTNLEVLDIRDNELDSEIPTMPGNLVTILLSKNLLSGEIPRQFGDLIQLQHLDLSFNLLEGTPPAKLFSLPNISYLNLGSNMLNGSLPKSTTCSSQLGFVDVSINRLSGDLPSCLSSNLNKRVVKFGSNCLNVDPQNQHDSVFCQVDHMKEKDAKIQETGLMVSVCGGIAIVALLVLLMFQVSRKRNCQGVIADQRLLQKQLTDGSTSGSISQGVKLETQVLPTYQVFSFEELKEATRNFERAFYIGEGSIGKLYKGRLENGTSVAVRCLALVKGFSIRNLKLRLDLLAKLRHPHLVSLLGHCIDDAPYDSTVNIIFLIYEYIPTGNLSSHLSECSPEKVLNWTGRLGVLLGVAKAVHFLHTGIIPGLFNNRLKTNNILLDQHCIAKVSDYGLSIISDEIYRHEAKVEGQRMMTNRSLSLETEDDIYSVGLIILEALVGLLISEKGLPFFMNKLAKPYNSQEGRKGIIDPIILKSCSE